MLSVQLMQCNMQLEDTLTPLRGRSPRSSKERLVVEMVGTPLTHERFLRRTEGTYGNPNPNANPTPQP